jgi:hypothetical protein
MKTNYLTNHIELVPENDMECLYLSHIFELCNDSKKSVNVIYENILRENSNPVSEIKLLVIGKINGLVGLI